MINNIIDLLYLIILILIIVKLILYNNNNNFKNIKYDYFRNINTNEPNTNKHNTMKKIRKNVTFNEQSNEYYDNPYYKNTNTNKNIYNFDYNILNNEIPFMNNLSSWYNNTWIDHFDSNNKPVYKSSNTDINNNIVPKQFLPVKYDGEKFIIYGDFSNYIWDLYEINAIY